MKKIEYFLVLNLLFHAAIALAQRPLYDNYQFNRMATNPAFTGIRGHLALTGVLGSQFNGTLRPTQVFQNVVLEGSGYEQRHNIGFQGFNANYARFTNTGLNVSYAYRMFFDDLSISIGTNAGLMVQPNVIATSAANMVSPYVGFGALAATDNLYISVGMPQLFQNTTRLIEQKRPIFTQIGAFLGEADNVMLHPNALFELNNAASGVGNALHANLSAWFGGQLGVGASYRMAGDKAGFTAPTSRWVLMGEYQFSTSMRLGLAYDTNPLQGIPQNNTVGSSVLPKGVVQLMIRYEAESNRDENPRFRFF